MKDGVLCFVAHRNKDGSFGQARELFCRAQDAREEELDDKLLADFAKRLQVMHERRGSGDAGA